MLLLRWRPSAGSSTRSTPRRTRSAWWCRPCQPSCPSSPWARSPSAPTWRTSPSSFGCGLARPFPSYDLARELMFLGAEHLKWSTQHAIQQCAVQLRTKLARLEHLKSLQARTASVAKYIPAVSKALFAVFKRVAEDDGDGSVRPRADWIVQIGNCLTIPESCVHASTLPGVHQAPPVGKHRRPGRRRRPHCGQCSGKVAGRRDHRADAGAPARAAPAIRTIARLACTVAMKCNSLTWRSGRRKHGWMDGW